tara:strand:- start:1293 stop:1757 length:465 start_codon:yes stop_codon:yes gene_type:complete
MGAALPFVGPALSLVAAKQASDIGKFNQSVANRNAVIAKQEAEAQAKLTEFNIAKFNQSFEKFQSTTKVAILKSGVEISGTALNILQSNAEQAELQRDVIEYNGKVAEAKKLEEANFARMSGSIARMQGRQQAIGYLSQAGSSLLTMKQMGMFS